MALLAGISVMSGRWRPQPGGKSPGDFPGGVAEKYISQEGPRARDREKGGFWRANPRRELGVPKRGVLGGPRGTRKWPENGPENGPPGGPFSPPGPPGGPGALGPRGPVKPVLPRLRATTSYMRYLNLRNHPKLNYITYHLSLSYFY